MNEILLSSLLRSLKPAAGNFNEIQSHQRFVIQMFDNSAGLEGSDLCLVLKELSGVMWY